MNIQQAMGALAGRADLFAARPDGVVLMVNRNMAVKDLRNGKMRCFTATYSDLVTDDWQVVDRAGLDRLLARAEGGEQAA